MSPDRRDSRELALFARRLGKLGGAILLLVVGGTLGFVLAEDVSLWDGFTWALDTIATTGSIQAPTDTAGEAVKVVLTLLGVGTLFYALVTVTEFFVSGHLGELLADRRRRRMIEGLSDHFVICGYGRVGRQVARDLRAAGARYVVIDPDPANVEVAQGMVGVRAIVAEPSDDEALRLAGIERARAVVAAVDSDAENIFITLTARELNPTIAIVARASVEDSERKLKRAGADRVISPYQATGAEMARLALHPQVSGSVDVDEDYRVEEIQVSPGCQGAGQALRDIRGGAMVVGLRRDGGFQPQPPGDTILSPGDVIVAMGTPRTMDRLEKLFAPHRADAAV
jgi:voltage-gated potassium channel